MGKCLLRFAVAAAIVMLALRPAAAWTCNDFATLAAKAVNAIRAMGGCGFDLTDSFYSGNHYRWCRSMEISDREAVETRLKDLTAQADKCEYCNSYATLMSDAARDNIAHGCGFRHDGYLWSPHRQLHFNGCMAFTDPPLQGKWVAKRNLDENIGEVTQKIAECKKRHPVPKGCMSGCHGGSQSVFLARPEALLPPPKRGSSGHNFSVARQPPSFKRDGTSSGDSDNTSPPGERRRNPRSDRGTSSGESDQVMRGAPNPCGSELKPCKPSRIMTPGLLDGGGGGGGTQGPAATGAPLQSGAPSPFQRGSGGGGSGLR
jgi:hypothetical protein